MKVFLLAVLSCFQALAAVADEGLWLFNQPPRQLLRERYQFDASDAWLKHLQKSSVRFSSGSGSFVSEDGLLISNQHVGAAAVQKLSTKEKNYFRGGFYAPTPVEELKCVGLEVSVLLAIEDVTARISSTVPTNSDQETAATIRHKIIAEIEEESLDRTGLRSDVVTLWNGGAYHLYRYKRYTDVRLVFAPEEQIALYGGDPDNFEYPRYDLDICLFRAYENGQPAKVKDFLKYAPEGAREGDLVFISGHPAQTFRALTVAEVEAHRDRALPWSLGVVKRREAMLANWSARSEENARRAKDSLDEVQNDRKLQDGILAGLLDPEWFSAKTKAEADFKVKLAGQPEFANALAAYDKIAETTHISETQAVRMALLVFGQGFNCKSFGIALTLLRAGEDRLKANGERPGKLPEPLRASLESGFVSAEPIYADYEILTLADSLTFLGEKLGMNDSLVQRILAGKSPRERAAELINETKVYDVTFRKRIYEGGASAVSAANDPMIELVRLVDAESRPLGKMVEMDREARRQAYATISSARNRLLGTIGYPDATFTLRFAFGTVKGYEEDGHPVPAFTTIAGLFERAKEMKNLPPFDLPPSWEKRKSRLGLNTPFNFVSTCDFIGGNSGSPVVNRAGEFVGIGFDANLQSIPWPFAFSGKQGRAIAVYSAAILEALDKVYGANELRLELLNGRRSQ